MNHPNSEELLDLALGFDSTRQSHVDQCRDCAQSFQALEIEQGVLNEYYASVSNPADPDLTKGLPRHSAASPERRHPWGVATVAASLLICMVLLGMLLYRDRPRPHPPAGSRSQTPADPAAAQHEGQSAEKGTEEPKKTELKGKDVWVSSAPTYRQLSFFILSRPEKSPKENEYTNLSEARRSGVITFPDALKGGWTRLENTSDKILFLLEGDTLKADEHQEYRVGGDYRISAHGSDTVLVIAESVCSVDEKSLAEMVSRTAKALDRLPAPRGLAYALGSKVVECDLFGETTLLRAALPSLMRNAFRKAAGMSPKEEGPAPALQDVVLFLSSKKGITTESSEAGEQFLFRKVAMPR
jgi:hypothetical protein